MIISKMLNGGRIATDFLYFQPSRVSLVMLMRQGKKVAEKTQLQVRPLHNVMSATKDRMQSLGASCNIAGKWQWLVHGKKHHQPLPPISVGLSASCNSQAEVNLTPALVDTIC